MALVSPFSTPRTFVLCFDGTGNKFSGTESDSNVLKIFRMLDRSQGDQFHYYQPGIGTYVTTTTLSNTGLVTRMKSSYMKLKDYAIGSSFADHVMAGYRFLMRYYTPGDEIYFFGFSRGAYIARFLAEMLDYVGLLTTGNEELVRFAWKTFAKWQQRLSDNKERRQQKVELFNFMKAFRETFSRPINRIRFIGLFDTVNSVPRFESAWMQRNKFPYTAKTTAKVIRHAVGIDERRAKFRQDLISGRVNTQSKRHHKWNYRNWDYSKDRDRIPSVLVEEASQEKDPLQGSEKCETTDRGNTSAEKHLGHRNRGRYRPPTPAIWKRPSMLSIPRPPHADDSVSIGESYRSNLSLQVPRLLDMEDDDEDDIQDIKEVWFPGGHADIGGGWGLASGEIWPLSHAPLVWMVQEARQAGLRFDERKLKQFECDEMYAGDVSPVQRPSFRFTKHAELQRKSVCEAGFWLPNFDISQQQDEADGNRIVTASESFKAALHVSSTKGQIHDCLAYDGASPRFTVLLWRLMEYLPFKRMDLQPDGSWKPIRWPLPRGEVRDIPDDALIHSSAIRRMEAREDYRPGNLIIGGGGRGVKRAGPEHGIGEWDIVNDEGCPIRETLVRRKVAHDPVPCTKNGSRLWKKGKNKDSLAEKNGDTEESTQNGQKNGVH
ncbi:hypothetical protein FQN57_001591 [Myotisia sp. PD_48]|nr:hypothetical protein FQN57_001591 [Myotisia sp. PD_48]